MNLKTLPSILLLTLICAWHHPISAHDTGPATTAGTGLKVLVYSNTAYYRHPEIPSINRWLVLLGHE
ncbi:MAG: hypothetical protein ACOYMN_16485, partial [Roseimicrobium sp.]